MADDRNNTDVQNDDDSSFSFVPIADPLRERKGKLPRSFSVLVIEDDAADFEIVAHNLDKNDIVRLQTIRAKRLSEGLQRLAEERIHIVLLDLELPDSRGVDTIRELRKFAPDLPIVVLTGIDDQSIAYEAVREGAQDYLVKGQFDGDLLIRSMFYALARHRQSMKLAAALNRIQSSEQNLKNVIDSASDGIVVVDEHGTVVLSNPATEAMFGRTAENLRGTPFGLPLFLGEPVDVDVLRDDGSGVPVELRAVEVEWHGKKARLAILHDLTERKRAESQLRASEEQFRSVTETATEAVVLADSEGVIVYWNQGAQTMFGYSRAEVLAEPLTMLMPESYRQPHGTALERCVEKQEFPLTGKSIELEGVRKDGEVFPLELSYSTWVTANGRFFGGIMRDITERERSESQRIRLLEAERDLRLTEHEIRLVQRVQNSLFPAKPPELPGFDVAGGVYPAVKASGDYYDFIPMPGGVMGLAVGDVSGHGLGPAMLMAQTQATLRTLMQTFSNPAEILRRTNQLLPPNDTGRFVTLILGRLEPRTQTFDFASAGHPGYLLSSRGDVTTLESTGMVLGLEEDRTYGCSESISLEPGDVILLPTDGIQEAKGPGTVDNVFGIPQMLDVVRTHRDKPAAEIIHTLYHAARDFSCDMPQEDDMAMIVVKVL